MGDHILNAVTTLIELFLEIVWLAGSFKINYNNVNTTTGAVHFY